MSHCKATKEIFLPLKDIVNDGIDKELASLSYVVSGIVRYGQGTLIAKMDIHQAYRNISVHPSDRLLFGMQWKGLTFVDGALPFGLRSAPLIFSAVANAAQWVMKKEGVCWVDHCIDDFVTLGPPNSHQCQHNVDVIHEVYEQLGLPVEPEKDEGPATTIVFLGIELDSSAMAIQLPAEKFSQLRRELSRWRE